ncbi:MAG TPA: hypothetical protein VG318_13840 [Actinomycetota bacterium]|nr:hypothetical protein [Actinomycetota bacterium]
MKLLSAALALLFAGACASAPSAPAGAAHPDVEIVQGTGYHKSVYEDADGRTVVSFRIEVTNRGTDAGRSEDPRCQVMVRGELHDLVIFENPELAPGEDGWFRTGGAIPDARPGELDDLEAWCGL